MDEVKMTYEEAYAKLEELVRKMENGELSLDESIKSYEEGMKLLGICEGELNKYEKIIEKFESGN